LRRTEHRKKDVSHVTLPRKEIFVQMNGIVKRFPGVVANDHVNFELRAGEVHGLLGENGSGKTTLMNVLYGILRPEEGEVYMPREAINLGIGMVHQHFKLVELHTVLKNILLRRRSEPDRVAELRCPCIHRGFTDDPAGC
jgi:ABC-type uncharacterized transport system ATPase subunit